MFLNLVGIMAKFYFPGNKNFASILEVYVSRWERSGTAMFTRKNACQVVKSLQTSCNKSVRTACSVLVVSSLEQAVN